MTRAAVTAPQFAKQLRAAGAVVTWQGDTDFTAVHGRGEHERSARVWFLRDSLTFGGASSGAGSTLRSMTAVRRYLRLPDPPSNAAAILAASLEAKGVKVVWRGANFHAAIGHGDDERWAMVVFFADGRLAYGRGARGLNLATASAIRQHLGVQANPAQRFATRLQRLGAAVTWHGPAEMEARTQPDGAGARAARVFFHPVSLAFRGGHPDDGRRYLRSKAEVLRHLGLG